MVSFNRHVRDERGTKRGRRKYYEVMNCSGLYLSVVRSIISNNLQFCLSRELSYPV